MKGFLLLAFLATTFLATPSNGQSIDFNIVAKNMFTSKCNPDEYSDWTDCMWPGGDLQPVISKFISDAVRKNCKAPPKGMVKLAYEYMRQGTYSNNTLYVMLPREQCGYCGRRVQCCPTSRSFLAQSYKSDFCSSAQSYCSVKPINDTQLAALQAEYTSVQFNGDRCDFAQFGKAEFDKIKNHEGFPIFKAMLCQIYKSTQPKINCVSVDGQCRCCCMEYVYRDGQCVKDNTIQDTSCA